MVAMLLVGIGFSEISQSAPADATLDTRLAAMAESPEWLNLLHYRKNLFGGYSSEVDGPDFFVAEDGKSDPLSELKADLGAFTKKDPRTFGKLKQSAVCAFPVRLEWIKTQLGSLINSDKYLNETCTKRDEFMARLKPAGVTLVFSSAYPNNPGSMFGHTFLKIRGQSNSSLLDTGLSYAASVSDDDNSFVFMAKGLFGGYAGQYSILPYYAKVNEYVHSESRDLWEYELSLTVKESERLVLHAWEFETTSYADYFFTTENCSYQIMALIEAIKPEWDLTSGYRFHTVPAETIKRVLKIPGAVKSISVRPSLRRKLNEQLAALNTDELKRFKHPSEQSIEHETSAKVLDALATNYFYLKLGGGELMDSDKILSKLVLLRRSQMPKEPREEVSTDRGSAQGTHDGPRPFEEGSPLSEWAPHLGHSPYRLGVAGGFSAERQIEELSFRFAYHDLLNLDQGYVPFSQIEFPQIILRGYGTSRLELERVGIANVYSVFPFTELEKRLTWELGADYLSPKDFASGCIDCHVMQVRAAGGASLSVFDDHLIVLGMATARGELGESLRAGYRVVPGARAGVLGVFSKRFKYWLSGDWGFDFLETPSSKNHYLFRGELSWAVATNLDLRAKYSHWLNQKWNSQVAREGVLGIGIYF